jgi:predicted transposase
VSQYQTSSFVIDASTLVKYVTITGKLTPASSEDCMKLARLARSFRKAVSIATRMIAKGVDTNSILRELRRMLNKAYADSAYKIAKAIVEGSLSTGGDPLHIEVKKLFIISEGESSRFGNRNVRFESTALVKVKYGGSWIHLRAEFGGKYLPLLRELIDLANQKKVSYNASVVFRNGEIYLHLSIPIQLYLSTLGRFKRLEGLLQGLI